MSVLLDTTIDLIKIPSTADKPEELHRIIAYVEDFFRTSPGLIVRTYLHHEKPAIVVSTVDTLTPDLLMMGHLDVVPASPALFIPQIVDGHLIGRGACDMKSENAVMMHVMRTIAMSENPPNVALMLTTDEEVGGMDGARHLVEDIGYRCRVALVPDGGDWPEELVIESKGAMHVRLTTQGKPAHGSTPWEGKNAIEILLRAYDRLQRTFPETDLITHWHTTCNLGTVIGGRATNQVPAHASCTLDLRYPGSRDRDELLRHVQTVVPECAIEVLVEAAASVTPLDHPEVQRYGQLLKQMQQHELKPTRNHGGHDGRFLTSYGIPVLISRPRSGDQHTDQEWVDLESLEKFYELYLTFVTSMS